jgi:hypothetical protein
MSESAVHGIKVKQSYKQVSPEEWALQRQAIAHCATSRASVPAMAAMHSREEGGIPSRYERLAGASVCFDVIPGTLVRTRCASCPLHVAENE